MSTPEDEHLATYIALVSAFQDAMQEGESLKVLREISECARALQRDEPNALQLARALLDSRQPYRNRCG